MRERNKFKGSVKAFAAIMASAVAIMGSTLISNASYNGEYYGFGLDYYETDKMEKADGYSNGDMFSNCTWRAQNVNFNNGCMELSITRDPYGNTPYAGGEYRSRETFGYGMYDVKMKPIKNDGVVSSFFTYTGPTDGTVWDEIDIEFLGKNTNQNNNYNNNYNQNQNTQYSNDGIESGKTYVFYSKYNNKTLDIAYWSKEDGANIQQWDYLGQDNQKWIFERQSNGYYKIRSAYSGKVLDVSWCSKDNGANIQQWSDVGGNQQLWKIEKVGDAYKISNVNSGKVIDIYQKSRENSGNIAQWDYNGGANQLWYLNKIN